MKSKFPPTAVYFLICEIVIFCLLVALWTRSGDAAGFFLLLSLAIMSLLRWRFPKLWFTVAADGIAVLVVTLAASWEYTLLTIILPLLDFVSHSLEHERRQGLKLRDEEAGRYYELESLQSDLTAALSQVERMTVLSERARIAREIHDNAGHEIVAAYISLQTARDLIENPEALELYDAALKRLDRGVDKIRQAVHNLAPVAALGVEGLRETCARFPACKVDFNVFGDFTRVPMYVWSVLEACLNEALTNAARHADASRVSVDLDVTAHIIRLCVENDGVRKPGGAMGSGLRNLRQRAAAIGGSLAVDTGASFKVVCVIPIEGENFYETADS